MTFLYAESSDDFVYTGMEVIFVLTILYSVYMMRGDSDDRRDRRDLLRIEDVY